MWGRAGEGPVLISGRPCLHPSGSHQGPLALGCLRACHSGRVQCSALGSSALALGVLRVLYSGPSALVALRGLRACRLGASALVLGPPCLYSGPPCCARGRRVACTRGLPVLALGASGGWLASGTFVTKCYQAVGEVAGDGGQEAGHALHRRGQGAGEAGQQDSREKAGRRGRRWPAPRGPSCRGAHPL